MRNDAGSSATASALDLPRSRLRTWIDDGGAPDVVRGIETAHEYGWLECEYDDSVFTGLNALVANVFSGGSIGEHYYRPSFALNHRDAESHVIDAFELVGVDYDIVADRDDRADEVRPAEDGTVLGRVLVALGAPVGPKADQHLDLPAYLEGSPDDVREPFVYSYLENRAVERDQQATLAVREARYRDSLAAVAARIDSVAGAAIRLGTRDIVLSAAARNLGTVR